ncbi:hypothetical protein OnM2_056054 [Erysiphe neolycopersici]|uniref:Uncharacterized protein n=1 Tax=Erysiphe neolycopersici TaxID=212602 RepID=A0A420HQX3_9PEZI|nr:hypothetical protein OnM2_056054 [Erysiphe neolycopersici]
MEKRYLSMALVVRRWGIVVAWKCRQTVIARGGLQTNF